MKTYLEARDAAGTPKGIEYAERLAAMPTEQAVDEIADMFCLCAPEDLASDIACDLQLDPAAAERIAAAIIARSRPG